MSAALRLPPGMGTYNHFTHPTDQIRIDGACRTYHILVRVLSRAYHILVRVLSRTCHILIDHSSHSGRGSRFGPNRSDVDLSVSMIMFPVHSPSGLAHMNVGWVAPTNVFESHVSVDDVDIEVIMLGARTIYIHP